MDRRRVTSVKFKTCSTVAKLCARRAFGARREENGTWKQLAVPSLVGAEQRIYVCEDKSKKEIATEIATKRLARIIRLFANHRRIAENRGEGQVSLDGVLLVSVIALPDGHCRLLWAADSSASVGVDSEGLEKKFHVLQGRLLAVSSGV